MRTYFSFFCLLFSISLLPTATNAQTGNFDETWKEFLENNKISDMSVLIKPNKQYEQQDYAKYLLMNTNSNFCQSDVEDAEELMAEIQQINAPVYTSIPGYVRKMDELKTRIDAYHTMDAIWGRFLQTRSVTQDELEAVEGAKASCEKQTLAKYSFMTAYQHFCEGNVVRAKDIFENRTLRLAEKTSLRVEDVEGLAGEVANMKSMFQDMDRLDAAWNSYVQTGVSPGLDFEIALYPCNPVPKMKELVLKGALDLCSAGPEAIERIKTLETQSGISPPREVARKIADLEALIGKKNAEVAALNEAWEAFIPDNVVKHMGLYGYEYCEKEPLIRAYIMDGFAYVCELGEEMLQKIDDLQNTDRTPLEQITMIKINELAALTEEYKANGAQIERIWDRFVAQGDRLTQDYVSADFYCDNINQVQDWTMKGLSGTCEQGIQYLEQIEDFQRTFEFNFYEGLECRVQRLRIKVWECRHDGLLKLAKIEAPEAPEARLEELMLEYGMGPRPEDCIE